MFIIIGLLAWVLVMVGSIAVIAFNTVQIVANGDTSKWLGSIGTKFQSDLLGENFLNKLFHTGTMNTLIAPAISIGIAVLLFIISIAQLTRIRKGQKIQKPFVKVLLLIIIVYSLLMGTLILVVFAAILLIAFMFIEILLFDTEALNNYAEERNLISIYKEEKKFVRQLKKQGKYNGNAGS